MRFAYLCSDFGVPYLGSNGSSVHVRETVAALRRLGHEVRVFCASLGGCGAFPDDVHVVPLSGFAAGAVGAVMTENLGESAHVAKEVRSLLFAEAAPNALLPALERYAPDAIYERYALFAYAGVVVARELGVPLLLEVNAPLRLEQERHRQLVLKETAARLEREIWCAADALVVVSRSLAEYARGLGVQAGRITVVPNGVDVALFEPAVSGANTRRRYRLGDARVVGFVGSLKRWHDLETLRSAVALVASDADDVRLLVVGDGPERQRMIDSAGNSMVWAGAVEHERVPEHLAAMDVVVTPYAADADA